MPKHRLISYYLETQICIIRNDHLINVLVIGLGGSVMGRLRWVKLIYIANEKNEFL